MRLLRWRRHRDRSIASARRTSRPAHLDRRAVAWSRCERGPMPVLLVPDAAQAWAVSGHSCHLQRLRSRMARQDGSQLSSREDNDLSRSNDPGDPDAALRTMRCAHRAYVGRTVPVLRGRHSRAHQSRRVGERPSRGRPHCAQEYWEPGVLAPGVLGRPGSHTPWLC